MNWYPLFTRIFLTGALSIVAVHTLVWCNAYIHFLVPIGTVKTLGPTWYLMLTGLVSGGVVGAVIGLAYRNVLKASFPWLVACILLVLAQYAWFLSEIEKDWQARGSWLFIVDLVAFAVVFVGASRVCERRGARESAI